jgi:hypothetical protein
LIVATQSGLVVFVRLGTRNPEVPPGGGYVHGAVELHDAVLRRPLHLGHEVRVAGRVDQGDGDVVDRNDTTADLMVIPRCRSSASESV